MTFYFQLQYQRFSRLLKEQGVSPIVGIIIGILVFIGLSFIVFIKAPYPQYIYPLLGIASVLSLNAQQRNEFLKNAYSVEKYRNIRLLENALVALPFILFLLFKMQFLAALVLLLGGLLLAFYQQVNRWQLVFPTPFSRKPYEYIVGFRQTYPIIFGCYILAGIGVAVDNFNLGLFALLVPFLVAINFYTKPEPYYYVWVHADDVVAFLKKKIKTGMLHSIFLTAPSLVLMLLFYPAQAHFILLFLGLGTLYIATSILSKYAYYPSEFNLLQALMLGSSLFIPPLLLFYIPFLYRRAKRNLSAYLV